MKNKTSQKPQKVKAVLGTTSIIQFVPAENSKIFQ